MWSNNIHDWLVPHKYVWFRFSENTYEISWFYVNFSDYTQRDLKLISMTFKYHDFSFHFRFSALESRCAEISYQLNHVHAHCPGTGKYSRHCRPCPQKNTEENERYRTASTLNCPFRFIRFSTFLYDLVCTTRYCFPTIFFFSFLFLLIKSVHFPNR